MSFLSGGWVIKETRGTTIKGVSIARDADSGDLLGPQSRNRLIIVIVPVTSTA